MLPTIIGWLILAAFLSLPIIDTVRLIITFFDRGIWQNIGAKPDPDATANNTRSYGYSSIATRRTMGGRVPLWTRTRTELDFDDGYQFITYTKHISNQLLIKAYSRHQKAAKKQLRRMARRKNKQEKAEAAEYNRLMNGLQKEQEPGAARWALLCAGDPQTVREAEDIRKQVFGAIAKSSGSGKTAKETQELLLINEYKPMPGGIGCFRTEEGWALYIVADDLELWVKGPFSQAGIVSALTKTLRISTAIAPVNFTVEETDIFLGKAKPIARYEADLKKKRK